MIKLLFAALAVSFTLAAGASAQKYPERCPDFEGAGIDFPHYLDSMPLLKTAIPSR